jgi:hypothetical protein
VATGNSNIYFYNATLPVPGYLNSTADQTSTVHNIQGVAAGSAGTHFWASENVRRDPSNANPIRANPAANVTLNALNVAGKSNLSVTVALADAAGPATGSTAANPEGTGGNVVPRWEQDDFVRVQYNLDNTGWVTIGQFVGDDPSAGPMAGRLRRDANLDGVSTYSAEPNSPILTQTLTDYSFAIPGSGSSLQVRVQIDQDGASEEFGFDNIRVYGSAAASAAPVLAGIEGTALAFAEGQAATQITNGITVSDTDSPNLSGATVTISTNYQASEDQLVFINQNGITGSYNTGTGILTMTGAASVATYQAALRSVQYQNADANDASTVTRTVSFNVVDNASVGSNTVTRNITVTAALDPAYIGLPYVETFENPDGEGTRYASNHFFTQNGAQFQRTNTPTIPGGTTFANIVGSYYWVGANTNFGTGLNPTGTFNGTVTTKQINTAGYINLSFQIRVGASTATTSGSGPNWKIDDYFQLRYRTAGNSTWTAFGMFRGTNPALTGNGVIRQDANANGTGTPTGTQLTETLQNFTFSLPTTLNGQTLEFQMLAVVQDANNLLAFDQIQVTGTQAVAPTVITADATNITTNGTTLGGNVTSDGGATLNGRGVVYSNSNTNPTIGAANTTTLPAANGTSTGTFSVNATNLALGTSYSVAAYAVNNIGTSYGSVKAFVTTPNAPVVTTPVNGATVATRTPTYTGMAQNGATVTVYVDGSSIGTTTATGAGNWSLTRFTLLAQGPHTVFAQATITVNGITSSASANNNTNTFTVDTTPPAAPVVIVPANGSFISIATPTYAGTAEANSAVTVIVDGISIGTTTANASGNWSRTQPTALAQGSHTVRTTTTDAAGNGSPSSNTNTFTVDTTAPTVTITSSAGASGGTTSTTPIPFTVTFSENVTGFVEGDLTVNGGGLPRGVSAVQARHTPLLSRPLRLVHRPQST